MPTNNKINNVFDVKISCEIYYIIYKLKATIYIKNNNIKKK